ncbi:GD11707 [Drosophila simulans]|uniref:GD11707 n=1 Tax=Drosophila simulans TaxID=7240 RepID=B4QHN3_DROSI|nr:GD11707 [Drosophila simulans]
MAIEGFVHGAPEDYTVQSQTAVDEDERIKRIVESGDLEQLAEIVLNGEGGSLVGLKSPEPEIQAFLNNVPSYMEKIHRVHDAARDGGLLALQQALDRRKFAIAKNDISPNGSTPLHVAVLFGHTDIVRYLASRFPETMTITDNDGRTPLHYAATIKDNGHFYNMLLQLGANPKSLDKLGHSAEFYLDKDKAKNILNYTELLNIFGAEELENQLLNDQGKDTGGREPPAAVPALQLDRSPGTTNHIKSSTHPPMPPVPDSAMPCRFALPVALVAFCFHTRFRCPHTNTHAHRG